ncbi:MAG: protoporphyrinogen IX and coproporphyrinogen III oxidase HemY [uncultured bacterium]|nr:MAG: protoporphyrinogen IX and coproporphyrinogen III oxidase HemY [uncultured bacterium]
MRRFAILIIIFIFSVWLGLKVAEDPGLALFAYRNWSVEMPLWFLALSFFVFILLFYFVIRFFDSIDASFTRFKTWARFRRKSKSYSKTNRGLVELLSGHFRQAENYLLDGIDQADAPIINFLAAAKAAHEQGVYDKRDLYLRKAYEIAPQAKLAIGLTQAQLQFDQGQLEQTLATLNHLRTIAPIHPIVLKLLQKVYTRLADWQGLLMLLPSLRKAKLLSASQLEQLELHVYEELLRALARKSDIETLQRFWKTIPRRLRKDPKIIFYKA